MSRRPVPDTGADGWVVADHGSSTSTVLAALPLGFAVGLEPMSLVTDSVTGHQDLYFSRWSCRNKDGDIYALEGVDTV